MILAQEKAFKKIAKDMNLTVKQVLDIWRAQCSLTKLTFEEGKDQAVRWPLFGVFRVKPARRIALDLKHGKREQE